MDRFAPPQVEFDKVNLFNESSIPLEQIILYIIIESEHTDSFSNKAKSNKLLDKQNISELDKTNKSLKSLGDKDKSSDNVSKDKKNISQNNIKKPKEKNIRPKKSKLDNDKGLQYDDLLNKLGYDKKDFNSDKKPELDLSQDVDKKLNP